MKSSKIHAGEAPRDPVDTKPAALRSVPLTEDEADLIIALRRKDEPGIPLEQVLAEHRYKLDD